MKRFLKSVFGESLFKHTAVILVSSAFTNVANLVFWLYMVRKLSIEDYGVLNSLVSVMMFFTVPLGILQTVITRYVSKFMAHDRKEDAASLLFYITKIVSLFFAVIFMIFVLFGRQMSLFLRLPGSALVYFIGFGLVFYSMNTVAMGALYGLQKFKSIATVVVATSIAKLSTGFSLVAIGFKVMGAISGFIASFAVSFILSLAHLPNWLKKIKNKYSEHLLNKKDILQYFIPAGISMLSFYLLTNADIVLVKHYFSPVSAGFYSVAQMVGKIVLFVPGAIGLVMFPKAVENHTKNSGSGALLKKCLIAVGGLCAIAAFFSLIFPGFILKILTGQVHSESITLVKFFAVSMSFFAMVNILMLHHLSLKNMRYIWSLCAVSIIQIIGIIVFHSSLKQILYILCLDSAFLFFWGLWLAREDG